MIAAAIERATIEPAEVVLGASGVVVLFAIARRSLAGRPLLHPVDRPFRPVSAGVLLLVAAGLFVIYAGGAQLILSARLGAAGVALGIAVPLAAAAAVGLFLRRDVLLPRGSVAWRIGMGLLFLWAALPVVFGTYLVCRLFGPEQQAVDSIRRRAEGWQGLAAMAVFVAPVLEEICFRGLLYPALRKWVPASAAIPVTSVAFALAHHPPTTWLPLAILAALLGWLVETTGSVVPSIAAHMAFNAIPVVTLLLSGPG